MVCDGPQRRTIDAARKGVVLLRIQSRNERLAEDGNDTIVREHELSRRRCLRPFSTMFTPVR